MPTLTLTPEELFDRPWRAGMPFRPGGTRRRQTTMVLLLALLVTIIGGYAFLTDADRVRRMAETTLSEMVGGKVEIKRAHLSIFEGLRLDGVTVRVPGEDRADSVVFSAQSLLARFNVHALLNGRLDITQILALDPHVRLCQDLSLAGDQSWNYLRLRPRADPTGPAVARLPEVLLRNGQVDYARIVEGRYEPLGSMAIEGQLAPLKEADRYTFELESRGMGQTSGPRISGTFDMATREVVDAQLHRFDFSGAIKTILPSVVQTWLEAHDLTGQINVTSFTLKPDAHGGPPAFRVETDLVKVNLAVRPEEWFDRADRQRVGAVRDFCGTMRACGFNPAGGIDAIQEVAEGQPIRLAWVTGKFVFTREGVQIASLQGWVEKNSFSISGEIHGYTPDAAAELSIASKEMFIPESPHYLASLPPHLRDVFYRFHTTGTLEVAATLRRAAAGGPINAVVDANLLDCSFRYRNVPFPLAHLRGRLRYTHDGTRGDRERIELTDMRATGADKTANASAGLTIDGWVEPLDERNAVQLRVTGQAVTLDDALLGALGEETQATIRRFAPPGLGYPKLYGDFEYRTTRPEGLNRESTTEVDLTVRDATAMYAGFPLPLSGLNGVVRVRPDHVALEALRGRRGNGAQFLIDGRVDTPGDGPARPRLTVRAAGVAIDEGVKGALPADLRAWVERLGIAGLIDLDGTIFPKAAPVPAGGGGAIAAGATTRPTGEIDFDLRLGLREGTLYPVDGVPALTDVAAQVRATSARVSVPTLTGRRGAADVTARVTVAMPEGREAQVSISAEAKALVVDEALLKYLPTEARAARDAVRAEGTVDAEFTYSTDAGPAGGGGAVADAAAGAAAATRPAAFELVLHPRALSANPKFAPYALTGITGTIAVTPDAIVLTDVVGRHGEATVSASGVGRTATGAWDLRLSGSGMPIDEAFLKALPAGLASVFEGVSLRGKLSFDATKFTFTPPPAPPAGAAPATGPATRAAPEPRIEFAARVTLADASLEAGVPLTGVNGTIDLAGTVEEGGLRTATGKADLASLQLAERGTKNLRFDIHKPADREAMQLVNIQAVVAGGNLAGQIDLGFPTAAGAPGQYALAMALQNADVRLLTAAEAEAPKGKAAPQGRVTASLRLQGNWGDANSRRGGGDVLVSGKDLYHIPVILGLHQITNLSLPISSPFNEATSRYVIDGPKIGFEQIELRAGNVLMSGSGSLDFDTKQVQLTFVTDSEGGFRIPLLDPLVRGAKRELVQVHVRGTVTAPKVSASAFKTFSTTIDEVFRGSERPRPRKKGS